MDVTIGPVDPDTLPVVAAAIARWQRAPASHICYLALTADAIAHDLTRLEPSGLDASLAAWRHGEVVGFLAAEWDTELPRIWWHGPFTEPALASRDDLADILYERLRLSIAREVEQEEVAVDDRHESIGAFAGRHGFSAVADASALLVLPAGRWTTSRGVEGVDIGPIGDADRSAVEALHDVLFPSTHAAGARLAAARHHDLVLVATHGSDPVGYVAAERQSDGAGYIDFLGVSDAHRGRGIGRALVAAAVARLRGIGCDDITLTVRESNHTARRLYTAIGFEEERILRAWRKGF